MAIQANKALKIKVADEVWIATALMQRRAGRERDFGIEEIVDSVQREGISRHLRPGVYVHVVQHCVANRPANPARYRMLFETAEGRRRLFRYPDVFHFSREGGRVLPVTEDIPEEFRCLIKWYEAEYALSPEEAAKEHPLLALRGMGKGLWKDEDPDSYVRRLREGWE